MGPGPLDVVVGFYWVLAQDQGSKELANLKNLESDDFLTFASALSFNFETRIVFATCIPRCRSRVARDGQVTERSIRQDAVCRVQLRRLHLLQRWQCHGHPFGSTGALVRSPESCSCDRSFVSLCAQQWYACATFHKALVPWRALPCAPCANRAPPVHLMQYRFSPSSVACQNDVLINICVPFHPHRPRCVAGESRCGCNGQRHVHSVRCAAR